MPSSRIAPYREYVWRQGAVNTCQHHSSLPPSIHPSCRPGGLLRCEKLHDTVCLVWGDVRPILPPVSTCSQKLGGHFCLPRGAPHSLRLFSSIPSLPPQSQATSESSKPVRRVGRAVALRTCVRPMSAARETIGHCRGTVVSGLAPFVWAGPVPRGPGGQDRERVISQLGQQEDSAAWRAPNAPGWIPRGLRGGGLACGLIADAGILESWSRVRTDIYFTQRRWGWVFGISKWTRPRTGLGTKEEGQYSPIHPIIQDLFLFSP